MSGFHHDPAVDDELRLADGRRVTYSRFGDPDGTPVLNCHGGLMCRFDVEPCAAEFAALGAFVVSPDRPGVGGSDRKPGRSTVDWVDDARELLDALGIDRVAVMGWSMGGQYAAAVAARMPDRVRRLRHHRRRAAARRSRPVRPSSTGSTAGWRGCRDACRRSARAMFVAVRLGWAGEHRHAVSPLGG